MKTNDLLIEFHHARNNKQRTKELIEKYCEPIPDAPDIPGCVWYGKYKPKRGKAVCICNDGGQIIALNEEDLWG